jgi:hypothetical protein
MLTLVNVKKTFVWKVGLFFFRKKTVIVTVFNGYRQQFRLKLAKAV